MGMPKAAICIASLHPKRLRLAVLAVTTAKKYLMHCTLQTRRSTLVLKLGVGYMGGELFKKKIGL